MTFKTLLTVSLFFGSTHLFSEVATEETQSNSETEEFLEIGVGFSLIDAPHYAGSDQNNFFVIPFPYVVYESDKVTLNREGLNRHLLKGDNWDLDMSFAGRLPVRADDNRAREGMADLDWLFQAGPAYNYYFHRSDESLFKFQFPIHFGLATDFTYVDYAGWEFAPNVRFEQVFHLNKVQYRFISTLSKFYGSERFNQLYYSVEPEFATPSRPAYIANEGDAGYQMMLGVTRRKEKFWMGAFVRYRSVDGAVFEDSPLVKQKENFYAGVAFAWIIDKWALN